MSTTAPRAAARSLRAVLALVAGLAAVVGVPPSPVAAAPGQRYLDPVFADVDVSENIPYGVADGQYGPEQLLLDMYSPAGDAIAQRPVVVFAHGGYFYPGFGTRKGADGVLVGTELAKRGYVVLSIEYRLYDGPLNDLGRLGVAIPAAMHDMQAAVRWVRANAATHRLSTDAIAAGGYSAGAITALNTAFQGSAPVAPDSAGNAGYRHDVASAFAYAGWSSMVTSGAPPIQMFGGTNDTIVAYASQQTTCNAATAAGNLCEFNSYPGNDHIQLFFNNATTSLIPKTAAFLTTHVIPLLSQPSRSPLGPPVRTLPFAPTDSIFGTPTVANRDGRLEVLGPNADGTLLTVFQYAIGSGWSGFFPFPNGGSSATLARASTLRNVDGRLQVAVRGNDGKIFTTGQRPDGNGWLPIVPVGQASATFASVPVLARNPDNRLELFAVGSTGTLMHSWQDRVNGTFTDWYPLGASFSTAPDAGVAVAIGGNGLTVYGTTAGGTLSRLRQTAGGWVGPDTLPGAPEGRPVVAVSPDGGPHRVAFRGTDDALHVTTVPASGAASTATVGGGTIAHNPAIGYNADGRAEVFVAGADGNLAHSYQLASGADAFSALLPLGGSCTHDPSAVSNDDRRLEVFCVAADGQLRHDFQRWANGPWYGSTSLGGALVA